jgi:hypothetical protein
LTKSQLSFVVAGVENAGIVGVEKDAARSRTLTL